MAKAKRPASRLPKETTKMVTVKQVNNGFVISRYDYKTGREKEVIAKTSKEAMKITQKIFKGK